VGRNANSFHGSFTPDNIPEKELCLIAHRAVVVGAKTEGAVAVVHPDKGSLLAGAFVHGGEIYRVISICSRYGASSSVLSKARRLHSSVGYSS
jgi:hypothetical protein